MRSLFSNRYNQERNGFYERYEAARRLHPSLPLYERPIEPTQLEINDSCTRRRYRSYRELAHQTREQRENEAWLNSDRMPITVRRLIEERNDRLLMPRYNPTTARHVFSYNARHKRRGRRPAATTEAKIAADFAIHMGGLANRNHTEIGGADVLEDVLEDDEEFFKNKDDYSNNTDDENSIPTNSTDEPKKFEEIILKVDLMADTEKVQSIKPVLNRNLTQRHQEDRQNQISDSQVNVRVYFCPNLHCSQTFHLRRNLYQHQREKNHHNWQHKCSVCGQIFRKAGFKGMHTDGACQRNLQKQNK